VAIVQRFKAAHGAARGTGGARESGLKPQDSLHAPTQPRSPAGATPAPAAPACKPAAVAAPAKPAAVKPARPPPAAAQPQAKRLRRLESTDAKATKAATPLTPSLSDEETQVGAARASPAVPPAAGTPRASPAVPPAAPSARPPAAPARPPGSSPRAPPTLPAPPADGEAASAALAWQLHAAMNCTPARTSRARGAAVGGPPPRHATHGDDPGLLPSC